MSTLTLRLVTPEAEIFHGDIDLIHLPGVEGEMEILPLHEPLLTQLAAGELFYLKNGVLSTLAIGDGFAEVTGTSVSVLTDGAIAEKDIDEKSAEEAIHRAEEALRSQTLVGEEIEATEAALARSAAQLHLKRRRSQRAPSLRE